jgi:hypothetical protein
MDNRYKNYYVIRPKYGYKDDIIVYLKEVSPNVKFHNQIYTETFILSCNKDIAHKIEFILENGKNGLLGNVVNWYQVNNEDDISWYKII